MILNFDLYILSFSITYYALLICKYKRGNYVTQNFDNMLLLFERPKNLWDFFSTQSRVVNGIARNASTRFFWQA